MWPGRHWHHSNKTQRAKLITLKQFCVYTEDTGWSFTAQAGKSKLTPEMTSTELRLEVKVVESLDV